MYKCEVVTLKNQDYWKKQEKHKGTTMTCQYIGNIQLGTDNYYAEATNCKGRGCVGEEEGNAIAFDIAVRPLNKDNDFDETMIKRGYIAILKEKIQNDLNVYRTLINKMDTEGKLSKEKANIELEDVIAGFIRNYTCVSSINATWEEIEQKNDQAEVILKEAIKKAKNL